MICLTNTSTSGFYYFKIYATIKKKFVVTNKDRLFQSVAMNIYEDQTLRGVP